ncbi:unnamed protein product [Peronospora destructor]|uniref:Fe2OG dioxygenase domain-containing protein n=1 Tax=Peronospora destructor TaxID=86335 RepID=A0AAV0THR9_9STRA|nr:unnamed protein product [Peronospora destructor]
MGTNARVGGSLLLLLLVAVLGFTFKEKLHEILHLTYEYRSLSVDHAAAFKSVTVYRNGYSTGGAQLQLMRSAELVTARTGKGELAAYLSQFVAVEGLHESVTQEPVTTTHDKENEYDVPGVVANRVYNGRGELLQTYADILSGDRLYLVAPGLLFMWPFVELGHRVTVTSEASPTKEPVIIESISESPRTFRLHNSFSGEEVDKLINRTLEIDDPANKLQQSGVRLRNSNEKAKSKFRTSENAFDKISDTAVNISKRAFDVLLIEEFDDEMCEGLQLLRYQQKQAYYAHHDYFAVDSVPGFNFDPHTGGSNRFATVFLYLSEVAQGGQTVFPEAEMPEGLPVEYSHPSNAAQDYEVIGAALFGSEDWEMDMVKQCSTKLAFYPSKGGAVLFYSQKPNGELDPMSLHGGCPVLEGAKWSANLWVWNKGNPSNVATAVSVIFKNPTSREVGLYWSDQLMATLDANGGSMVFDTFEGHKWVLKHGDHILFEVVIDSKNGNKQTFFAAPIETTPAVQLEDKDAVEAKINVNDNANAKDAVEAKTNDNDNDNDNADAKDAVEAKTHDSANAKDTVEAKTIDNGNAKDAVEAKTIDNNKDNAKDDL